MKKSLTTDPLSPLYVPNTPENSNIDILQNYITLFKDVLGNGVDLRNSRFSNLPLIMVTTGIKTIVDKTKNDNYIYFIGNMRNYSNSEQKTYQSTKDYVYSLSASVDANASFPVQVATVSVETSIRTGLEIKENIDIMNLTYSIYNENAQIDLNQLNFFDRTITPISEDFLNDLDSLIDNHLEIDNPEDFNSWAEYETFFQKYGTHVISSLILGCKIDIYYSSYKYEYSRVSDLKVDACVTVSMLNNILENYRSGRSGRLGDILPDDVSATYDWNSLDTPDDENGSHMTPRPNNAKIPVTYPPEPTSPPTKAEINVGICAGSESMKGETNHTEDINISVNILGGNSTLNGQLSNKLSTGFNFDDATVKLISDFLASADTTPGIMDSTYIPIWEFISNLFSISDIEKYYGVKRFQRFINNLINYFSFSSQYRKESGIAFYRLTPDKDTPVGYIVYNQAAPNNYALGSTSIWNQGDDSSANGAPFNFREYNHDCPSHYSSSIFRDGGYKCEGSDYEMSGILGICGNQDCDRGYNHNKKHCNCCCDVWDDQKVMYTAATQQLIFYGNPDNPEENVIKIAKKSNENNYMSIGSKFSGTVEINEQAIFGVNKSSIDEAFKDDKCIWKIDFTGRIRNKNDPNIKLCLEWQTDNKIYLKNIDETEPKQKFYLVKCDYIKPSDY